MSEVEGAIEALEELGLTEYEARCFVALQQLPHGTARDIGQVADIPRSRVYETMDSLHEMGLVELHEADPREYQSVSIDTALTMLRQEYDDYFETLERTLDRLEPSYKEAEQGVWAINTHEQVSGRIVDLLEDAGEEVVFVVLDGNLIGDDVLESLEAASERATVHLGTSSDQVRERVVAADVDAPVFSTDLIDWFTAMEGSPRIGRLLLIDGGPVLASAIHEEELPGVPNETAVWSDGIDHGFAIFMERVLTYEMKDDVADTDDPVES